MTASITPLLHQAHLRYVHDRDLRLRRTRQGKKFIYTDKKGTPITDPVITNRIDELSIPPAWEQVRICHDEHGHLQAVGYDAKGRKQYIYHPSWNLIRTVTKFDTLYDFGKSLPAIRRAVYADMKQQGLHKRKVVATVVWLLQHTLMRIGNEEYVKENKHYGLTTLRDRHAQVDHDMVEFTFTGKSGVKHTIDIHHHRVAAVIRQCQDLPGQHLFEYIDSDHNVLPVYSEDVNEYVKKITGLDATAKDFRTWGGSLLAAVNLYKSGDFTQKIEAKKHISESVKKVAEHLGNTPATCRSYYIHPTVTVTYLKKILIPHFDDIYSRDTPSSHISPNEHALIELIKKYPATSILES